MLKFVCICCKKSSIMVLTVILFCASTDGNSTSTMRFANGIRFSSIRQGEEKDSQLTQFYSIIYSIKRAPPPYQRSPGVPSPNVPGCCGSVVHLPPTTQTTTREKNTPPLSYPIKAPLTGPNPTQPKPPKKNKNHTEYKKI